MNSLPRKALLLLISISVSGIVVAGESAQAVEWLERMTKAMRQMSYQGTFVYIRDNLVETMRITHVADESGVRERMYSISGPRREVIRNRKGVRCVLEDEGAVVEDYAVANSYFPELPLAEIADSDAYRMYLRGTARIAGHTAHRISILPQDEFRYGYDFWLEEQTGLLLKWVLRNSKDKALAKLVFTDFSIGSEVDASELKSDTPVGDFKVLPTFSPAKPVVERSSPHWLPNLLPAGFKLSSHSHETNAGGSFEHLVYSDGLAAVSVYIEKQGSQIGVMQGVGQLGTNNAFSRLHGNLQITAIGEVPAITVKTIANSMTRSVASTQP